MQIEVRFVCPEVLGILKSGAYEVAEGASISDLMDVCIKAGEGTVRDDFVNYVIFLKNNKPAYSDTVLEAGDKVMVLRKIYGG